jgi:hypothetical protein
MIGLPSSLGMSLSNRARIDSYEKLTLTVKVERGIQKSKFLNIFCCQGYFTEPFGLSSGHPDCPGSGTAGFDGFYTHRLVKKGAFDDLAHFDAIPVCHSFSLRILTPFFHRKHKIPFLPTCWVPIYSFLNGLYNITDIQGSGKVFLAYSQGLASLFYYIRKSRFSHRG